MRNAVPPVGTFLLLFLLLATSATVAKAADVRPGRAPVPDEPAQARALEVAQELYREEDAAARTPDQRAALAEKLLDRATTIGGAPVEQYVLLRWARDVAVEAGDAEVAWKTVERLVEAFDVDPLEARADCVRTLAESVRRSAQRAVLARRAFSLVDDAIAGDRLDLAAEFCRIAKQTAQKAREFALVKQVVDRMEEVDQLRREHQEYEDAVERLNEEPTAPEANLVAGRYLCLVKEDWGRGIPMLALGSDAALREVARAELRGATTADAQAALGDGWWDLAAGLQGTDRAAWLARARHWYEESAPKLASGLEKARIEKRLEELAEVGPPSAESSAASQATQPIARGKWVDLLGPLDVERDAVAGPWRREAGGITIPSSPYGRVALPAFVEGSYELEVELTRHAGDETVALVLPVGMRRVALLLSAWGGKVSGLSLIEGRRVQNNPSTRRSGELVNGQRYRVAVGVQANGPLVGIAVHVNGQPYLGWKGKATSVQLPYLWWMPQLARPGLAAHACGVTFHTARLRLASGKAVLLEPKGPSRPCVVGPSHGSRNGGPFEEIAPPGTHVAGFRFRTTDRICLIETVYATSAGLAVGEPHGSGKPNQQAMAKPGYAVGGMEVRTGLHVDAVRVIFQRLTEEGRLDPDDAYESPWFGGGGGGEQSIVGTGRPVVGIHGRSGDWIDAIGLIFDGQAKGD